MARLAQRFGLTRYEADEHYKQALQAYQKRELDAAILAMDEAIELLPRNAEYYAARGFFYLEDGVIDKAGENFEQALTLHAYEPLAHYGRGMIAYNAKNWDEALAHFTDAYRSDPERSESLYYLALVYHHKHENANAKQAMEQAVAIMTNTDDKRLRDAERWIKEFERLIEERRQLTSGR